jgi:hypothetical protein
MNLIRTSFDMVDKNMDLNAYFACVIKSDIFGETKSSTGYISTVDHELVLKKNWIIHLDGFKSLEALLHSFNRRPTGPLPLHLRIQPRTNLPTSIDRKQRPCSNRISLT